MLSMNRIHSEWVKVHGREWTDRDVDEMHEKFFGETAGDSPRICKK